MLPPDYLTDHLDEVTVLYADLHTATLKDIARHIADAIEATGNLEMMPSTASQIEALQKSRILRGEIVAKVSATLSLSRREIRRLFTEAAIKSRWYDDIFYRAAGIVPVPVMESPVNKRILEAGISKQLGTLERLTGTFAINAEERFHETLNLAYNKAILGTHSHTEAVEAACDDLARNGIRRFHYESGRAISIEAAVLMNVRTGISQTAAEITRNSMVEMGTSYVQTSAHAGARTGEGFKGHVNWQGRQFYYREIATVQNDADLPDFVDNTGYGDVAGLCGANCRHSFAPFYPGISVPRYTPEQLEGLNNSTVTYKDPKTGEEKEIPMYDAHQHLRYLERNLRYWKRRQSIKESAGLDANAEKRKVREWSRRIKDYTDNTQLRRQPTRESIAKG